MVKRPHAPWRTWDIKAFPVFTVANALSVSQRILDNKQCFFQKISKDQSTKVQIEAMTNLIYWTIITSKENFYKYSDQATSVGRETELMFQVEDHFQNLERDKRSLLSCRERVSVWNDWQGKTRMVIGMMCEQAYLVSE